MRRNSWDGPPAVSARVTLICETGKVCGATKTDSKGAFLFRGIDSGVYDVVVKHAGYYPLRVSRVEVEENREMIYGSFDIERCFKDNCDPRLRPKKPLVVCE